MARQIHITFRRDVYDGPACLEYSWVPEGLRHTLRMMPGEREVSATDVGLDETSNLQVYVLTSNDRVSLADIQFPDSPPPRRLVSASVDVRENDLRVEVTVEDATGGTATGSFALERVSRPCPTP
jgi:hypothetical protein